MSDPVHYGAAAAGGYNRSFGSVSSVIIPTLLGMARVGPDQRVLDVATGTGIAAEAAAQIVGPTGHVVAADISAPMLEQARRRLSSLPNISFAIEDGQALTTPAGAFDAVLCSMALMLFPNPLRGLSEFQRVLHRGGWAAVAVNTVSERSFVTRISTAIGRHVPSRAPAAAQYFSLGDPLRLNALFEGAGFRDVETTTKTFQFPFPSFDAYFEPIEMGQGSVATEYSSLPAEVRQIVREEVRQELEGATTKGGPVAVMVEILYGSGRK
jgi:protein-L-isoaspartate O-methyltransferase